MTNELRIFIKCLEWVHMEAFLLHMRKNMSTWNNDHDNFFFLWVYSNFVSIIARVEVYISLKRMAFKVA